MSAAAVRERLRTVRSDPILVNSALMFVTTLTMAAGGAAFWVLAARLHSPHVVGLTGTLVSATEALALFAQLGLNVALIRTLPGSRRPAGDVLTAVVLVAVAGTVLGLLYALLAPTLTPELAEVIGSPAGAGVLVAAVAATGVTALSGSVFLSLGRVATHFRVNGLLMVTARLTLPFLLLGAGAVGLYGAVAGAAVLCAAVAVLTMLRHLPGPRSLNPSAELRDARRFAGAAYLTYALHVLPQMVLPLLVIGALGAADGGLFFISFQIVALQNAVLLAVGSSTYAEAEKAPTGRRSVVRRGSRMMFVYALAGVLAVLLVAPLLLRVFGSAYADQAASTLRVMSLGTLATALNYWGALRLRLSRHHTWMVVVQAVSTVSMLVLAWFAAPHGTVWVAAAWAVGHLVGGVLGVVVSMTLAPVADDDPGRPRDPEPSSASGHT